jgi:hypothetical protein
MPKVSRAKPKAKFVFVGKVEFDREDSGAALIAQLDQMDGEKYQRDAGLFVRIQSYDERILETNHFDFADLPKGSAIHADARRLSGKRVRVTIQEV